MSRTRQSVVSFLLLLLLLLPSVVPAAAAPPAQNQGDWSIPNGRFFTQTAPAGGFSVLDNNEARFWSEFQRLGGLQTVGYPISRRFVYDGFVTQAFQKLVLQWRPEVNQAWPVNVFDELSRRGFDDALLRTRQTPHPFPPGAPEAPGASWPDVVSARQGLLTANMAIRTRYFSVNNSLNVFGLPTSRVEDMGNHYAIRTQRAVFQQWKEAVPWAAAGQVTIANGGDIAKELGWLPADALTPESAPGGEEEVLKPTWKVAQLIAAPGTPGALYAYQYVGSGSGGARLMVSQDFGKSWQPLAGGIPVEAGCFHGLAMDYAANTLYATTCKGLYRWTGSQWEQKTQSELFSAHFVYSNPQKVWSTMRADIGLRVMVSEDSGNTWKEGGTGGFWAHTLALDPNRPEVVYWLTSYRGWWFSLSRSSGNGQWTQLPMPLETTPVISGLTVDGTTGAIYVSARSHEIAPGTNGLAVHQLWRTSNASELDASQVRWELVHDFGPTTHTELLASGWSPNGLALYAKIGRDTEDATLHRSLDGGHTWERLPLPDR